MSIYFSRKESGEIPICWHGEDYTCLRTNKTTKFMTDTYWGEYMTMCFVLHRYNRTVTHGCKVGDWGVRNNFVGSNRAGDVGTGQGKSVRERTETKRRREVSIVLCKFTLFNLACLLGTWWWLIWYGVVNCQLCVCQWEGGTEAEGNTRFRETTSWQ